MPRNKSRGGFYVPQPVSMAPAASTLWDGSVQKQKWENPAYMQWNTCAPPHIAAMYPRIGQVYAAGSPMATYGSLSSPELFPSSVSYDPRTISMRAPLVPAAAPLGPCDDGLPAAGPACSALHHAGPAGIIDMSSCDVRPAWSLGSSPYSTSVEPGVISVPGIGHGPCLWVPPSAEELSQRKTQFAPQGPITMQPILVDGTACAGTSCVCIGLMGGSGCTYHRSSMTALLLHPRNLVHVRNLMEDAGLITVTADVRARADALLARAGEVAAAGFLPAAECSCAYMGHPDLFNSFVRFASIYSDVSMAQPASAPQMALELDAQYVEQVLGATRAAVLAGARANYARAEGPRAFLQPVPLPADTEAPEDEALAGCGFVDSDGCRASTGLPLVLPGTGCRTTPLDTRFAQRALTDPRSCFANRVSMASQTGLPIGATPLWVAPPGSGVVMPNIAPVSSVPTPQRPFMDPVLSKMYADGFGASAGASYPLPKDSPSWTPFLYTLAQESPANNSATAGPHGTLAQALPPPRSA